MSWSLRKKQAKDVIRLAMSYRDQGLSALQVGSVRVELAEMQTQDAIGFQIERDDTEDSR